MLAETSASLLSRVRNGHAGARQETLSLYQKRFHHWVQLRMSPQMQAHVSIEDLISEALNRSLDYLIQFSHVREGSFIVYFRQQLQNSLDQLVNPDSGVTSTITVTHDIDLHKLADTDALENYERALGQLQEIQREAVILKAELHLDNTAIAAALDCPSANAARNLVVRSLLRLSELMEGDAA